jgi:predicted N-formylglutamate amidohydrolase
MKPLLQENEPDAVGQYNILGNSEVIILCPHAGNLIPQALGSLGISEIDRQRHIA